MLSLTGWLSGMSEEKHAKLREIPEHRQNDHDRLRLPGLQTKRVKVIRTVVERISLWSKAILWLSQRRKYLEFIILLTIVRVWLSRHTWTSSSVMSLCLGPVWIGVLGVVGDCTLAVTSDIGLMLLLSDRDDVIVQSTKVAMVLVIQGEQEKALNERLSTKVQYLQVHKQLQFAA